MNSKFPPIGICGVARSGKDTACKFLIDELSKLGYTAKKYALADELKNDLEPFIREKFDINIHTCEGEEKSILRPLMVSYGNVFRELSKGQHWTSILEKKVKKDKQIDIPIITDIRYDEYEKDEVWWLKNKLKGVMVHVSRYQISPIKNLKEYILPPNENEAKNDPKLKQRSEMIIDWDTFCSSQEELYLPHIQKIIQTYFKRYVN